MDGKVMSLIAPCLALFLAAMDATVVAAVIPEVVRGVDADTSSSSYAWLISGFIVCQVVFTPVAGWTLDRFGARVVALTANGSFLVGSLGASASPSLSYLIACRMLQGAGAAGLVVFSYSLVGRLFESKSRARAQGLLSSIWGAAALGGPILGSCLVAIGGWRLVFAINVPLCILLAMMASRVSMGAAQGVAKRFPLGELLLVSVGSSAILIGVQGKSFGLNFYVSLALCVAGVLAIIGLRRFGGALIPESTFKATPTHSALISTLSSCIVMYGAITVIPVILYRDGVVSWATGFTVACGAIGWVSGSSSTGVLVSRVGVSRSPLVGALIILTFSALLTLMVPPAICLFGIGLGTGIVTASMLVAMQDAVPAAELGTATSAATMFRSLGAALGVNVISLLASEFSSRASFYGMIAAASLCVAESILFTRFSRSVSVI